MSKVKCDAGLLPASQVKKVIFLLCLAPSVARSAPPNAENRVTEAAKVLGISPATHQPPNDLSAANESAQAASDRLVQIAISQNRSIAIEEANRSEIAAAKRVAWAKLQPTINLFAGQSQYDSKTLEPASASGSNGADKREYGLNLRMNLFNGGSDWASVKAADRGLSAADIASESQRIRVTVMAQKSIVEFNQAAMELRLAEAASASAADLRSMSLRKFNAGLVGKIDLHKTEVREAEAVVQVTQAKLNLEQAKISLLRTCGIDHSRTNEFADVIAPLEKASLPIPSHEKITQMISAKPPGEGAVTFAERIATLHSEKADLESKAAYRSRWIPAIDFTASLARNTSDPRGDVSSTQNITSTSQTQMLGLELNWKLWAPADDGRVAASIASREKAELKASDTRERTQAIRAELMARITSLVETLQTLRQAWERTSRLYDAETDLYQAGAVDIFELINSETQRLGALKSWRQSRHSLHLALIEWEALNRGFASESSP